MLDNFETPKLAIQVGQFQYPSPDKPLKPGSGFRVNVSGPLWSLRKKLSNKEDEKAT